MALAATLAPVLTVEEARRRILSGYHALAPVELPLPPASGLVSAEDVTAPDPLPRFANSAMDGYAVRRVDVAQASPEAPARLRLAGETRAGDAPGEVGPAEALRILTGAAMPAGADAVVPVEEADDDGTLVWVRRRPPKSGYVRHPGEDVREGATVLSAGTELQAGELALLAALGIATVKVHRRPRVAVVVTGDEVVGPDDEPRPGQIRDSNTIALRTLIAEAGGDPREASVVADSFDEVVAALDAAAADADLIVSSGGVSVGRYDFVRAAVAELGSVDLWKVAMQPGKPVVAGDVSGTKFLGLPGNPVSVHVTFEQFVRPAIRAMLGHRDLVRPMVSATLSQSITKRAGRLHFVRVRLEIVDGRVVATPTGPQGSHIMSSLVGCDGLARFDAEATRLEEGDEVVVELWRLPRAVAGATGASFTHGALGNEVGSAPPDAVPALGVRILRAT